MTWQTLAPQNGWAAAPASTMARGARETVIFTIPAGYRPAPDAAALLHQAVRLSNRLDVGLDVDVIDPIIWDWPARWHGTVSMIRPPGYVGERHRSWWMHLAGRYHGHDLGPDPILTAYPRWRGMTAREIIRTLRQPWIPAA